jgi:hypothetical protein
MKHKHCPYKEFIAKYFYVLRKRKETAKRRTKVVAADITDLYKNSLFSEKIHKSFSYYQ